ncbi:preprotein translocase Sec, Sec61-beta subunit protein [Actinidia rufa]|uniref:Preprotein translocase Sec, Sec61-beta subunit protein n=1 Tax=Actinidia rufa TaxID=165716 RepID=A0A7J0DHV4_9ERIC|nr:preprotein translocase Sec, Sec61-beta subunit protein [Actinidia rufa]
MVELHQEEVQQQLLPICVGGGQQLVVGLAAGASGTMLQFYTDDAPGLRISPNVVLVISIGFIAFVSVLHVVGKLYFVRREA